MKHSNELNKTGDIHKIDWKKVTLEKLRKSLDADLELRSNIRKTMSPARVDNKPDKLHNFI